MIHISFQTFAGRFSNVFRARYTYQEQGGMQGSIMVAIKEPEKDALDSEMQREINIMAQLTHQNIVRLIGIVQRKSFMHHISSTLSRLLHTIGYVTPKLELNAIYFAAQICATNRTETCFHAKKFNLSAIHFIKIMCLVRSTKFFCHETQWWHVLSKCSK